MCIRDRIPQVYGRSIWDASLGSYSYDTYETWQEDMDLWMSHLETTGETEYLRTDENTTTEAGGRKIDFVACLDSAGKAGIDYILLPEDLSEDVQKELQEAADGLSLIHIYHLLQTFTGSISIVGLVAVGSTEKGSLITPGGTVHILSIRLRQQLIDEKRTAEMYDKKMCIRDRM